MGEIHGVAISSRHCHDKFFHFQGYRRHRSCRLPMIQPSHPVLAPSSTTKSQQLARSYNTAQTTVPGKQKLEEAAQWIPLQNHAGSVVRPHCPSNVESYVALSLMLQTGKSPRRCVSKMNLRFGNTGLASSSVPSSFLDGTMNFSMDNLCCLNMFCRFSRPLRAWRSTLVLPKTRKWNQIKGKDEMKTNHNARRICPPGSLGCRAGEGWQNPWEPRPARVLLISVRHGITLFPRPSSVRSRQAEDQGSCLKHLSRSCLRPPGRPV